MRINSNKKSLTAACKAAVRDFLLEHILCLFKEIAEDVFVVLFALLTFEASKFFEQVFLLGSQTGRGYNFDDDMLVATGAAMYHGYTHAFEAEGATALSARRNLERGCFAVHGGNLHLITKGCLGKANGQFIDNVVALPLEELVRFYRENNVQVTWGTTTRTDFALACYTNIDAIIDTGWNIDDNAAIVAHASLTTTFLTGSSNDAAFATTAFTHRDVDKLPKNRLLHPAYLTGALAGGTAR